MDKVHTGNVVDKIGLTNRGKYGEEYYGKVDEYTAYKSFSNWGNLSEARDILDYFFRTGAYEKDRNEDTKLNGLFYKGVYYSADWQCSDPDVKQVHSEIRTLYLPEEGYRKYQCEKTKVEPIDGKNLGAEVIFHNYINMLNENFIDDYIDDNIYFIIMDEEHVWIYRVSPYRSRRVFQKVMGLLYKYDYLLIGDQNPHFDSIVEDVKMRVQESGVSELYIDVSAEIAIAVYQDESTGVEESLIIPFAEILWEHEFDHDISIDALGSHIGMDNYDIILLKEGAYIQKHKLWKSDLWELLEIIEVSNKFTDEELDLFGFIYIEKYKISNDLQLDYYLNPDVDIET